MKKIILAVLVILLLFSSAYPQDEFKKYVQKQQQDYQKFIEEQDRKFAEFLKTEWKQFGILEGKKPDKIPKPVIIPTIKPALPIEKTKDTVSIVPKITPSVKIDTIKQKDEPKVTGDELVLSIVFFGVPLKIECDKRMKVDLSGSIDESQISDYWQMINEQNYQKLLDQIQNIKNQLQLNDWGYYILLKNISAKVISNENFVENLSSGAGNQQNRNIENNELMNERRLFEWFLLLKSGYDARLGYKDNSFYLLIASDNIIYGVPYFVTNGTIYYLADAQDKEKLLSTIKAYDGNYSNSQVKIDLHINKNPDFKEDIFDKILSFNYDNTNFSLPVRFNRNLIDFYKDYPYTNISIYFDAFISAEAEYSLLNSIKPLIQNKSEVEAANILLRFVQTAFKYMPDGKQFNREKPLFVEETLFYPYSDCEDRAILFSFLVRKLLKLDVVGLDYPGHIAVGVNFNTTPPGNYYIYKDKNFTMCDPTYEYASVGECMPKFKNTSPEIIIIH